MAPHILGDGSAAGTAHLESPPSCPVSPGAASSAVDSVVTLKYVPTDERSTLEFNELNPLVS